MQSEGKYKLEYTRSSLHHLFSGAGMIILEYEFKQQLKINRRKT